MARTVVNRYLFAGRRDIKTRNLMMVWLILFVMTSHMEYHLTSASANLEGPVRKTQAGSIQGYLHTLKTGRQVERYLGVPYAKPPVDALRFEKPEPPDPWNDTLSTTTLPPACVQERLEKVYILTHNPYYDGRMSEDCLYINIYVPYNPSKNEAPIPVLIHVHGGSNMVGMGAMFHGDVLASEGNLIVVTLNYRLGPFGFLFIPEIGLLGNYGLYDQNLAFKWVKDNIASFGGDPQRITVQGHSAGSADVGFHVISPLASGLFQSAILQSGSPTSYWAVTYDSPGEDHTERRRNNLKLVNCDGLDKEDTLSCLRKLTYIKLSSTYFQYKRKMFNFSPAIDGQYITDHPSKLLAMMAEGSDHRLNCDTIMIGVTNDEGSLTADVVVKNRLHPSVKPDTIDYVMPPENLDLWSSVPDDAFFSEFKGFKDLVRYVYTPWQNESSAFTEIVAFSDFCGDFTFTAPAVGFASGLAGVKNTDVYFYNFDHVSTQTSYPAWMGVPHGEDQFYLFGCPVEGHILHNYTKEDKLVSLKMIQTWAHFVYHRNLSLPDGSLQVPRFTESDGDYLEIQSQHRNDDILVAMQHLRKQYLAFWTDLVPKLKSKQTSGSEQSWDKGYILWILVAFLCLFVISSIVLLICLICHIRNTPKKSDKEHHVTEDSGNNLL